MNGDELERLAAACLLPSFAGLEPPDWVRRRLADGLGGVVLFARNVHDREQVAALTAALRAERADAVVAIDEEGGDVTRLEAATGSSYPGNLALGVVDDVELTRRVAGAIGTDLARAGVDVNLAPVADVAADPASPIVGVRAFGADPELVARHVAAFVSGLQAAGVAACAKHFPGHGHTHADSHVELPAIELDRSGLDAALLPFRAAVDAGARAVMAAHVRVPALDDAPASASRPLLQGLLRQELGFGGLVVTDALDMGAISSGAGIEEGAVQALSAGADAICLGPGVGGRAVGRVQAAVVDAVQRGRLGQDRLAQAAARVAGVAVSSAASGPAVDPEVGREAAERALHVEGEVALSRPALVVELRPPPSFAAGEATHGLADSLRRRDARTVAVRLTAAPPDPGALLGEHSGHELVVVVRDAHRHAWQRAAAESLLAGAGGGGVLVETGLPLWRPAIAPRYVAAHGMGRVNLDAAAARLVGASS